MLAPTRERRWWTKTEDEILQNGAQIQINEHRSVKNWNEVASLLPGRTNKDCRKRWSKVRLDIKKGAWTPDEDERLQQAVAQVGFKWTTVSTIMQTRHADQCAKRWQHVLGPDFKHAPWTPEEDRILQDAIAKYGNNWKQIGLSELPDRSSHDIRNRSVALSRRIRGSATIPTPKPSQPSSPDSSYDMYDDEEPGAGSGDNNEGMASGSWSCICGSGAGFSSSRGLETRAALEPPALLYAPMNQTFFPNWEMSDSTTLMQPPQSADSNSWFQPEAPVDSSSTDMLDENAFDFGFLDEGMLKNITENQGRSSLAHHYLERTSGSSPSTSENAHVSGERKGSVTVVLKGDSSLTPEVLGSLMSLNANLTIRISKD